MAYSIQQYTIDYTFIFVILCVLDCKLRYEIAAIPSLQHDGRHVCNVGFSYMAAVSVTLAKVLCCHA